MRAETDRVANVAMVIGGIGGVALGIWAASGMLESTDTLWYDLFFAALTVGFVTLFAGMLLGMLLYIATQFLFLIGETLLEAVSPAARERSREARERARLKKKARDHLISEARRISKGVRQRGHRMIHCTPRGFEEAVGKMYEKLGYRVNLTPLVGDAGYDLIAENDEEVLYVECKRYGKSHTVGRPTLQKLVGAADMSAIPVLATTSSFSGPAKEYAEERGVRLVDAKKLGEMSLKAYPESPTDEELQQITVMCGSCGELVPFEVGTEDVYDSCSSGHVVKYESFWFDAFTT